MRNYKKYDNRNLYKLKKGSHFFTHKNNVAKTSKSVASRIKTKIKLNKVIKNKTLITCSNNSILNKLSSLPPMPYGLDLVEKENLLTEALTITILLKMLKNRRIRQIETNVVEQ